MVLAKSISFLDENLYLYQDNQTSSTMGSAKNIKEIQAKENSQVQSGQIEVSTERDNVTFSIHLNFVEQNSTTTEKILCKSIPLTQFADDTLSELEKGKKIYAVDAPKE